MHLKNDACRILPFVEDDLNDVAQYIGQDNPERAVTFVQDIRAKLREIGLNR